MLQAILIKPHKIELRETPTPEPSGNEILLKVRSALTCGTDLKAYLRGHKLTPMPGPLGHEYSGIVAKTGRNVKKFKEGDPVMGVHSMPCLICPYCKKGLYHLCERIMDTKAIGAYAEYLLIPEHIVKHNLFHKPDSLTFNESALIEPLSCVVHPYKKINLQRIDNALIIGVGAIGLMHLKTLSIEGIRVFVTDLNEERLEIARKMGASGTFLPDQLTGFIEKETEGIGFDLLVECTGQVEIWENSVNLVRRGGMIILFGGCKSGTFVNYSTHRLHYDEITLMGSFHFTPADVKKAYHLLTEKKIDLSSLITAEYPLREIQEVFKLLAKGKGIKYAIVP